MECRKEKFLDLPVLDRNSIKDIPWAKNMWTVLEDGLNKTFLYWCQIVLKMGENEEVIKEWVNIFVKAYEETSCELVTDMERVQNNVLLKIERLLQEFEELCQTLQTNMPVLGDKTQQLSLHEEQEELIKHVDEYKKLVEERRAEVHKLCEKQSYLCNSLGIEPKILKDDPLPTCEEIEAFQKYIEKLEKEKFYRLEKYFSVKEELLRITRELNREPSSQFEKTVFSWDESEFLVTDENMKKLDILLKRLINQQKDVSEEIAHLRIKVSDYWNILDVDQEEREEFQQKYTGISLDVLQALQIEIKRCENLKKANLKTFVDKLRCELEQLWDKCHCSQTMKMQFAFFHADCYTEDLLELHEVETAKWKKYYEENKELLTLLEKHQRLWKKMVQLEENTTGPNRYNNRGGQLLKEEKERNKLAKQIPQIEEMLFQLDNKYRQKYNDSFSSYGISVVEYLANLHEERENAKKQKLSARKMQREHLTPVKSVANQNLKSSTPLSSTKRKLATPHTDETKKPRALNERKMNRINKTPASTNKISVMSGHAKRVSVERKKRINKIRRLSSKKEKAPSNSNETISTNYEEFQSELINKSDCRSTLIPSEVTPTSCKNHATPVILVSATKTLGGKASTNLKLRSKTPNINNKFSTEKPNVKLKLLF